MADGLSLFDAHHNRFNRILAYFTSPIQCPHKNRAGIHTQGVNIHTGSRRGSNGLSYYTVVPSECLIYLLQIRLRVLQERGGDQDDDGTDREGRDDADGLKIRHGAVREDEGDWKQDE